MPMFVSEGYSLAYDTFGDGPLVLLDHGFASNGRVNWVETGWVDTLTAAGYRAAIIDNRGHGQSEKIYDPAAYAAADMALDALNLVGHLGAKRAALVGYSMGARIAAFAALAAPQTVAAAVFGGLGIKMVEGMADSDQIVEALEAPDLDAVTSRSGRAYRIFAERTGSDLKALAACMRSSRQAISAAALGQLEMPVLVAVGSDDTVGGAPEPLAALMPRGEAFRIEGRDHMRATGDKRFKAAVTGFFGRHYPANAA
jgi:pimeloyl-ACP methyl ester carboxylesterase